MVKPARARHRLVQIEKLQAALRSLAAEFPDDFDQPNALNPALQKELARAVDTLDLLKGLYKSKTSSTR